MKNINKMLDNSAYIYANRQNLVLAIEDSNGLKNKVVKLVGLLRSNANSYDIKNLFDNMLIIDQTIKSFADNISADVDKQLAGITEQGFLDKNLTKIKISKASSKEYIQELKALMTKINGMVGMLKQANEDLKAISVASKNIQGNFDELSRTIKADGKDDQMYISRYVNILESKELVHNETINNCNSTRKKIESTISVYNSILSQIRREIDIVNDINYSRDTGKQY